MRELPVLDVRDLSDLITLSSRGLDDIHACGAFGDIRLGALKDFGPVALKTLSVKGRVQPELRLTKVRPRWRLIWDCSTDQKHTSDLSEKLSSGTNSSTQTSFPSSGRPISQA